MAAAWRRPWAAPAAIALLLAIAVALNRSGADLALVRLVYDPVQGGFRYRDHPILVHGLHDGAKMFATLAGAILIALAAIAWMRPSSALAKWRDALGYLAVAALGSALLVSAAKQLSSHSCPWNLAMFGGTADFFPLFAPRPPNPGPGRCLPSGHASVAFMWIGVVYALGRAPPAARRRVSPAAAALIVLCLGALVSLAQVLRGAHFPSHVVLTAAICWATAWALDRLWPAGGVRTS